MKMFFLQYIEVSECQLYMQNVTNIVTIIEYNLITHHIYICIYFLKAQTV